MEQTKNEITEMKYNMKGFLTFWGGQLFSILGSSIIQFVLAWWITIETQSALLLSLSTFIAFIPTVLLTPLAGVFVDRWNRKALIGGADFLQAASTVVLVFLFKYDLTTIPILFVFLALRGVFQAFHSPATMALIPIMVPKKHLMRINSVQYFFTSIIYLIGPIVAALLFKFFPIHQILWLDAITFCIAVVPLLIIKIPKIEKTPKIIQEKTSFFKELKEGFVFIKEKKGLLPTLGSFAVTNLFLMPLFTLVNLFVYVNHGGGETELAYVLAFNQAGTIASAILFIIWKGFKKKMVGIVTGIMVGFVGFLMIALTPTGLYWFMGIGFLITGLAIPIASISSQTIWQAIVPKEKLGRVMSVRIALAQATAPLGMIISGLIAEFVNIKFVYIGAASMGLFLFALFWFFSSMRKVEDGIIYDSEESTVNSKEEKEEDIKQPTIYIESDSTIDSTSSPTPAISIE